jgi:hypothetical protein
VGCDLALGFASPTVTWYTGNPALRVGCDLVLGFATVGVPKNAAA